MRVGQASVAYLLLSYKALTITAFNCKVHFSLFAFHII